MSSKMYTFAFKTYHIARASVIMTTGARSLKQYLVMCTVHRMSERNNYFKYST